MGSWDSRCNNCGTTYDWAPNSGKITCHCGSSATDWYIYYTCDCGKRSEWEGDNCLNCGKNIPELKWDVKVPRDSDGGCYIATACYGDYDATEVKVFREFRDKALQTNFAGRLFVKSYYYVSPVLAEQLKAKTGLNSFIRKTVLDRLYAALKDKYAPTMHYFCEIETISAKI